MGELAGETREENRNSVPEASKEGAHQFIGNKDYSSLMEILVADRDERIRDADLTTNEFLKVLSSPPFDATPELARVNSATPVDTSLSLTYIAHRSIFVALDGGLLFVSTRLN
ncbi:hypothetical protein [Streptomyces noursei]|uniref:hypothetical protein n=1 Tax=Streptomyces noursei TaxID=1971 RepID=UPI0019639BAE|nr:hypothetical protein [Streptomyces noursei]QRX90866.1 hypothetical protein JNO44_08510 [Streptomyces noursei]